ncbi:MULTISPECIES: CarD family transcriptional regulator [Neobacillus]|uniref:Transcription factor YdeB n=1 Tax=Neobacillus rhizophilus TaxID=2833579 RepID=A0A942YV43_9BACI|nr:MULTISPECIES: CarD family transcriptional regulator [Neobacillus]MBS4211126.1 transcription factor YdeB [Neobacillus rhizophilus]MBU8917329.1 transcription factor YdeB [Bacillus sp. FJAT-29953]
MFQVGDCIVYPMQGAGVIEAIEVKEIQGEKQQYYIINMRINKMQVMIPIAKADKSRIRLATDLITLENVLDIFYHGVTDTTLSMKERYKINLEKLKSGNIQEGAEVVRDLMRINKNKSLNSSEKQMLESARRIFISELGLIRGITENQAIDLLNNKVG